MYGKLFASTYQGSMVGRGSTVFAVWGYIIANTVKSRIEINPYLLAASLGNPVDEVKQALEYLCQPDPDSRSKQDEGRRLIKEGQFQYFVVNHEHYRSIRNEEERRQYNRVAKQQSRARKSKESNGESLTLPMSNSETIASRPESANAEAEARYRDPIVNSVCTHTSLPLDKNFDADTEIQNPDGHTQNRLQGTTQEDSDAFSQIKIAYPAFSGRQNWLMAETYAKARVDNGDASWSVLLSSVRRYKIYCEGGGVSGPQYVMTPATFFGGADKPWSQSWELPMSNSQIKNGQRSAELAALRTAEQIEADERRREMAS